MSKRKIVVFSEPGKAGVKRHVLDILNSVHLDQYEVIYVYSMTRSDSKYADEIAAVIKRGIRCIRMDIGRDPNIANDLKVLFKFGNLIWREKPEVVHSHASKAGFIGRIATKLMWPMAVTLFTPNVLSVYINKKYWIFEWFAAFFTDYIIASCKSEAIDILKTGLYSSNKICVIPLCIDLKAYSNIHKTKKNGNPTITACGRIGYQKNGVLFFDVVRQCCQTLPNVKFIWIGDFEDDSEGKSLLNNYKHNPPSNLKVTGWVDNPIEIIAHSDIFLMLSRYESFGYVNAEAQALGIPVIATICTGNIDLIEHGHNGYLVTQEVQEICYYIRHLMSNTQEQQRMGKNARIFIEKNFHLSKLHTAINWLYTSATNKKFFKAN